MWEYLSTYSKSANAEVSICAKDYHHRHFGFFLEYQKAAANGNKFYYRADFADYMVSLSERNAAVGFVRNSNITYLNCKNNFGFNRSKD